MGQVWTSAKTMATYNQAGNKAAAVASPLRLGATPLAWYRLDDGVMGGQSCTRHDVVDGAGLRFAGTLDTRGGGFASVRADFEGGLPESTTALRVRYKGDGKTYKVLLGNGQAGGPWSPHPSWQHDLPTTAGAEAVATLRFSACKPSFGGAPSKRAAVGLALVPGEMRQVGCMLSLLLSDGSPNPEGTFVAAGAAAAFALEVLELEAVA